MPNMKEDRDRHIEKKEYVKKKCIVMFIEKVVSGSYEAYKKAQ